MFKNNLELIIGPVCCGKSAELLRRVDRYQIAGYNVILAKPDMDTRDFEIKSRTGVQAKCVRLKEASQIYDFIVEQSLDFEKNFDIIAFDEAQFFSNLFDTVKVLLERGFKVIISGLDSDFNGQPFGDIPKLVVLSDSVTKLTAVCMKCKNDNAIFSQKLVKGGNQIEVGDLDLYQPRCFNCFIPGGLSEEEDSTFCDEEEYPF